MRPGHDLTTMPSEMLSGPDLGAGFLHQLTTERDGDRSTFTYHAQDGGSDANGPPKGPLDVFGFVHPASPCQFGGPRCWHRRFLLPFSETPRVRACYNRQRFVLATMIDQVYAGAAVDVGPALLEVRDRLERDGPTSAPYWWVGGSTAAWLLGAPVSPRDVDLGCAREGVDGIARALVDYLIEPPAATDWPAAGIVAGARAFVGTFASGARVEWAVRLEPDSAPSLDEWHPPPQGARLLSIPFRGQPIRVSRPEYALVRALEKSDPVTVAPLAQWLRGFGADVELMDVLLARSRIPSADCDAVRAVLLR